MAVQECGERSKHSSGRRQYLAKEKACMRQHSPRKQHGKLVYRKTWLGHVMEIVQRQRHVSRRSCGDKGESSAFCCWSFSCDRGQAGEV